jgi:SRSO17 transposase
MRKRQWRAECQVAPDLFDQVVPRLSTLLAPLVNICQGHVAEPHAKTSVWGLLADVARQNVASMADRCAQSRLPRQAFLGWAAWDDTCWREALRSHVKRHLEPGDGVWLTRGGFLKNR